MSRQDYADPNNVMQTGSLTLGTGTATSTVIPYHLRKTGSIQIPVDGLGTITWYGRSQKDAALAPAWKADLSSVIQTMPTGSPTGSRCIQIPDELQGAFEITAIVNTGTVTGTYCTKS